MKYKIVLIFFATIVIVLAANARFYDPNTGKIEVQIVQGWNLAPYDAHMYNDNPDYPNNCNIGSISAEYTYSPVENKYLGSRLVSANGELSYTPSNTQEILASEKEKGYYHVIGGGRWILGTQRCSFEYDMPKRTGGSIPSGTEFPWTLKKGWNFISIQPWMVGGNFKEIFGDCIVTSANSWDEINQKWVSDSSSNYGKAISESTNQIYDAGVGTILVIKFDSDCKFKFPSSTPAPPALP